MNPPSPTLTVWTLGSTDELLAVADGLDVIVVPVAVPEALVAIFVAVCALTAARRCAITKRFDILDILDRGMLKIGTRAGEGEEELWCGRGWPKGGGLRRVSLYPMVSETKRWILCGENQYYTNLSVTWVSGTLARYRSCSRFRINLEMVEGRVRVGDRWATKGTGREARKGGDTRF